MDFSSPNNHWNTLQESLAGSFKARGSGLTAGKFFLLREGGEEFGRLELNGTAGADLEAGMIRAEIRKEKDYYRMTSGSQQVLTARNKGSSADRLEVFCGGKVYETRTWFLRNIATAVSSGDGAVRVSGSLSGRDYEAVFEAEGEGAPAVAVFLLYHTAAHRQRAYLASR